MSQDPLGLVGALQSIPGIGPYLPYITMLMTLATLSAPFMSAPTSPTGWYAWFYWVVNFVAVNRGHATNLNSPAAAGLVAGPKSDVNQQVAVVSRPATAEEPPIQTTIKEIKQ